MKILWFSWKDRTNPLAGGAEVVAHELAKRLIADGHEVTFVVGGYKGAAPTATIHGYNVIRIGNRHTVYLAAWRYYRKHLSGWADLIIDEMNTLPFLAKLYVRERNILFVHQLCHRIWFYQLPWWLGWMGYVAEPLYVRLLSDRLAITVSESTRADLVRHGFKPENVRIISEGIEIDPVATLSKIRKFDQPTVLSLGSVRPMKNTLDQIKAFEIAKRTLPDLKLIVAGDHSGNYGLSVRHHIAHSTYKADIEVLGRVSTEQKIELMQQAHLLLVTSVKEGWGLVVTEAASQGTPSAVYNVDGLRDSVRDGETGLIAKENTPQGLAECVCSLLQLTQEYRRLQASGWEWSKEINFDRAYQQFLQETVHDSQTSNLYNNTGIQ